MSIFHHKWAPFDLFVRFMLIIIRLDRRVFLRISLVSLCFSTDFVWIVVSLHVFCLDHCVSLQILFGSSCLSKDFGILISI